MFVAASTPPPVTTATPATSTLASSTTVANNTNNKDVKESFDEFDFHLSPLGSLDNLYEAILPKSDNTEGGNSAQGFHYYDPVSGRPPKGPSSTSDGYLEPVSTSEGERKN